MAALVPATAVEYGIGGLANILRRALQRQHAAANLVFLDRFERRLEIAFAESVVTLAPDYLLKAVLRGLKSLSDIVKAWRMCARRSCWTD